MMFLGGKSRVAKAISTAMLANSAGRATYIEPFLGGAAVAPYMGPEFEVALYSDIHEDLALMWAEALRGWVPPLEITEEQYREAKTAAPSALRGFIGYACSFGGKWFGGYARNRKGENFAAYGSRVIARQAAAMTRAGDFKVTQADFFTMETPPAGAVVYLDPPYAGTTGYQSGAFPHDLLWLKAEEWARSGADVYVSEYAAPEGWSAIWEREAVKFKGLSRAPGGSPEKLFTLEVSK